MTIAYVHHVHATVHGLVDVSLDVDYMYHRPLNGGVSTIQRYVSVCVWMVEEGILTYPRHLASCSMFALSMSPWTPPASKTTHRLPQIAFTPPQMYHTPQKKNPTVPQCSAGLKTTYRHRQNSRTPPPNLPFHLAMGPHALTWPTAICQTFSMCRSCTDVECPAALQASIRCIVVREMAACHPPFRNPSTSFTMSTPPFSAL